MGRLYILNSLLMEAVHLREQSIGHRVTPLLHEPRLIAAPRLHLLPLAISALESRGSTWTIMSLIIATE